MDVEKLSVDGFNLNVSDAKARDMISDKYDPDNGTYVVGDTCINDDILYICNTDIDTPETFDSSKWDADTVGHYCSELKSNLTNLENYSTDEVVCGKWVDGKTLYKKTLTITITSTTQRGEIDIASLNVDKVVSIEGIAFQGNYARPIISSYRAHTQTTSAPSELSDVYFDKGSSRKTLVVIASGVNLGDCYITIKYTKTST